MLGERVAHYEIVEQLGRGGMGVVYGSGLGALGARARGLGARERAY